MTSFSRLLPMCPRGPLTVACSSTGHSDAELEVNIINIDNMETAAMAMSVKLVKLIVNTAGMGLDMIPSG